MLWPRNSWIHSNSSSRFPATMVRWRYEFEQINPQGRAGSEHLTELRNVETLQLASLGWRMEFWWTWEKETRRKTGRQFGKVLISCLFPEDYVEYATAVGVMAVVGNVSNLKGTPLGSLTMQLVKCFINGCCSANNIYCHFVTPLIKLTASRMKNDWVESWHIQRLNVMSLLCICFVEHDLCPITYAILKFLLVCEQEFANKKMSSRILLWSFPDQGFWYRNRTIKLHGCGS